MPLPDLPQAYIAGAYTAADPEGLRQNIARANAGAAMALSAGFLPIVPHTMGPHRGMTWDHAMDRCRALVHGLDPDRDVLIALHGWSSSRGAREEVSIAIRRKVRVIYAEEFLR